jgi:hypothetical protein
MPPQSVRSETTYATIDELCDENGYAFMVEEQIRALFPWGFPCDVVCLFDGVVVGVASFDLEESTGVILARTSAFPAPAGWQRWAFRLLA